MRKYSIGKKIWLHLTIGAVLGLVSFSAISSIFDKPSNHTSLKPSVQQSKPGDNSDNQWQRMTITDGDSMAKIFKRLKLSYAELQIIFRNAIAKKYLTAIRPGQLIYLQISKKNQLERIKYKIDDSATLFITKSNNDYKINIQKQTLTSALKYKSHVIHHSLAQAAQACGITHKLYAQLLNIFQGTINFNRDLHRGDHFSILYREYYINGKKNHPGNILAAKFTCGNKIYQAIRFQDSNHHVGYYAPNGHSLKPLLILPPLKYKRISSRFNYHRMDPYLHKVHPHLGIDYAAKLGTPVHSLGNGKVTFIGKDDGYGNAIIIHYGHKYKALYGHLNRFAKNLHRGTYVHQGQVIGYVGDTGWSTGPHLHLSIYAWGIARDPLKLHFPKEKSIAKRDQARFLNESKAILTELQLYEGPALAEYQNMKKNRYVK